MHIQGKRYRLDTDRKFSSGPSRLSLMMLGLTIGLLWIHFFVARPLNRELAALKSQVRAFGRGIDQLTATQPGIQRAQSLLAMLEAQGRQAESAHDALQRIAALEQTIQQRANTVAATLQSLQRLDGMARQLEQQQQRLAAALAALPANAGSPAGAPTPAKTPASPSSTPGSAVGATIDAETVDVARLRKTVAQLLRDLQSLGSVAKVVHAQAAMTLQAREIADELGRTQRDLKASIDAMKTSAERLGSLAKSMAEFEASPDRIRAARETAERLAALEKKLAEQRQHLEDSDAALNALIALKDTLRLHRKETAEAREAADELVRLARDVASTRETVQAARATREQTEQLLARIAERRTEVQAAAETADRLLRIHDSLIAATPELNQAESSLAALDAVQHRVRSMGAKLADSLKTLELLGDLDEELRTQVRSIDNIRRNLMEIVLLESAVGRVARILEPLAQLVDLRRLSTADIRAAAEVVLQRRAHRLAQTPRADAPQTASPFDHPAAPTTPSERVTTPARVPDPELLDTPQNTPEEKLPQPSVGSEQSRLDPAPDAPEIDRKSAAAESRRPTEALPWGARQHSGKDRAAASDDAGGSGTAVSAQGDALRMITDGTPVFSAQTPTALPVPLISGQRLASRPSVSQADEAQSTRPTPPIRGTRLR